MTEKAWSLDEETYHQDFCSITYDAEVGQCYWEGDVQHLFAIDYVNSWVVDRLLEDLDEQFYEDGPENAEACFSDVSKEAKKELLIFLENWAEKYVKIPYFTVKNVVEKKFTKEDLE